MTPEEDLRRVYEQLGEKRGELERDRALGGSGWGPLLGWQDLIAEEVLLYEQYPHLKEKRMVARTEADLAFVARNNALEKATDRNGMIRGAMEAFESGLSAASGGISDEELEKLVEKHLTPGSTFSFAFICAFLVRMEAIKDNHYEGSWAKRGEVLGAKANFDRKIDRIEAVFKKSSLLKQGETLPGESVSQTLGDASVYSIKWLQLRAFLFQQEFLAWLREIRDL